MACNLPKIELGRNALSDIDRTLGLEWIMTNGLGGYASSTVLGINTRKYHGVLVAAFNPPVNRRVMLSKIEEQLLIDSETYPLGSNEFSSGIHPQGYKHLEGFSQAPFPSFTYRAGEATFHKTFLMPYQKNASIVFYEISSPIKATLQIFPLVNSRHFHATTDKNSLQADFVQKPSLRKTILLTSNPQSALAMSSNIGKYVAEGGRWVEDIYFRVDHSQGTSSFDDCYIPGHFEVDLAAGEEAKFCVVVSAAKKEEDVEQIHSFLSEELRDFASLYKKELQRLTSLLTSFHNHHPDTIQTEWLKWLLLAADSFIVSRLSTRTKTVIAGYHWFEDWGRDSLISLPGLTLVTGRFNDAREILLTFKHYCSYGVVPNRFPDEAGEKPVYNTVDATLWYFNAVLQYLKYTGDYDFIQRELWSMLQSVVDYHIQGTINNIRVDSDGLIAHGLQLTWMDATVDNNPVTSREGKAVEIQALWYNALKTMELLATRFKEASLAEKYRSLAEQTKSSFHEEFWNIQKNCLYDAINGEMKDASLRPNQTIAVSLDFPMLGKAEEEAIVSILHKKLWATYGLKTLATSDSRYRGKYAGNWVERNTAYHNGTAWAWLIGPFVTAFLKTKGFGAEWRRFAFENFLQPLFVEQTLRAGLGTLSEVFDGDEPHLPGGCISQAWSVAEPLRAYVEDVLFERPSFERFVLEDFSIKETK